MQYLVILDRVIMAFNCIWPEWSLLAFTRLNSVILVFICPVALTTWEIDTHVMPKWALFFSWLNKPLNDNAKDNLHISMSHFRQCYKHNKTKDNKTGCIFYWRSAAVIMMYFGFPGHYKWCCWFNEVCPCVCTRGKHIEERCRRRCEDQAIGGG